MILLVKYFIKISTNIQYIYFPIAVVCSTAISQVLWKWLKIWLKTLHVMNKKVKILIFKRIIYTFIIILFFTRLHTNVLEGPHDEFVTATDYWQHFMLQRHRKYYFCILFAVGLLAALVTKPYWKLWSQTCSFHPRSPRVICQTFL